MKGRTFESREEPVILEKAMNPTGEADNIRRVGRSQPWDTVRSLVVLYKTFEEPHSADPLAMRPGEKNLRPTDWPAF